MFRLAYYKCFKCKQPYFGGMKDCIAAQEERADFKVEELICGSCSAISIGGGVKNCPKHGTESI